MAFAEALDRAFANASPAEHPPRANIRKRAQLGRSLSNPMTLARFLELWFTALNDHQAQWCVIRNYERFPTENVGEDIDILVADVQQSINLLSRIPGIRVTEVVPHSSEVSVFIAGVGERGLLIDLIYSLSWKSQVFLDAGIVLSRAVVSESWPLVRVPSEIDKAVIALFEGLLREGRIKERYKPELTNVFSHHLKSSIEMMAPQIGYHISARLAALVACGDYNGVMALAATVRERLVIRRLNSHPLRTVSRFFKHCQLETRTRLRPSKAVTIAVLGVDGVGKSTLLDRLHAVLRNTTGKVQKFYFRPPILYRRNPDVLNGRLPALSPQITAQQPWRWFPGTAKLFVWCLELWILKLSQIKTSALLQLYDRYFHDLLVDPTRYRYNGPAWLPRTLVKLIPQPDIWFVLDAPAEVPHSRKPDLTLEESARQRRAYLELFATRKNAVVVDACKSPEQVLAQVAQTILAHMAATAQASIAGLVESESLPAGAQVANPPPESGR